MTELSLSDLLDAEEDLTQQAQANDALDQQVWWIEGEPWYWQPEDKLSEWHENQWRSIGGRWWK